MSILTRHAQRYWALLTLSVIFSAFYTVYALQRPCLLDLDTYARAVHDLSEGQDPYRLEVTLRFVYHPLVLASMSLFGALGLKWLLVASYAACTLLFMRTLHVALARDALPVFALAFAFGGAGVWSVATGNVTAFMHLALLSALLHNAKAGRPQSLGFWALLGVLSVIKPYFLGYGLVPVVTERARMQACWRWLIVAISCGAVMLFTWLLAPEWHDRFVRALLKQTLGSGDLGMSFFGLILRVLKGHTLLALFGHIVCAILLLGAALLYGSATARRSNTTLAASGALYFALTWANPRMMVYDLFPALLALGSTLALEHRNYARHGAVALCLAAVPLLISSLRPWLGFSVGQAVTSEALWQAVATSYLLAQLARTSRPSPEPVPAASLSLRRP